MERERPMRRSWRNAAVVLTPIALSACSAEPERSDNITVISANVAAAAQAPAATRSPMSSALPTPAATPTYRPPLTAMKPHKDFADPPLPPELRDDGGLRPLPPDPRK